MNKRANALAFGILIASLSALSSGAKEALAAPIESNFESGLDGWTVLPGDPGTLSYGLSGGNPGGYARYADDGPPTNTIVAPAKFLGDWTSLNQTGFLSWDHRIIDVGAGQLTYYTLKAFISGSGGSATFDSGLFGTTDDWQTLNAPILAGSWIIDTGTWADILRDVSNLELQIEGLANNGAGAAGDIGGIDNVVLSAVPTSWDRITFRFRPSNFRSQPRQDKHTAWHI